MALALPELAATSAGGWSRACFRHFGGRPLRRHLLDPFRRPRALPRASPWRAGSTSTSRRARWARGSSCSAPTSATGSSSPPPIGLTAAPIHIVVRPADNPYLDRELLACASASATRVIPKHGAARQMFQVLRERRPVGHPDRPAGAAAGGDRRPLLRPSGAHQPDPGPALPAHRRAGGPLVRPTPSPGGRYRLVVRAADPARRPGRRRATRPSPRSPAAT